MPSGTAGGDGLHGGRGPWRRPGHVPGEHLDGPLLLIGIAISDWQHALWVVTRLGASACWWGSITMTRADEIAALGLYGYNATLAAVALFLWRRSLIAPLLGILLSVPLTELLPMLGLPALTAPFVLATWLVLSLGWLETELVASRSPTAV